MHKVLPFSSITIPPRFRTDYGDIPTLARGIIASKGIDKGNDIMVEEVLYLEPYELLPNVSSAKEKIKYILLAGGRRMAAYQMILDCSPEVWDTSPTPNDLLPFQEVTCKVFTDLTPEDRLLIEFRENFNRKDFAWSESSNIIQAIHKLKQDKYGASTPGCQKNGWSVRDTAELLGISPASVVQYLQLSQAMKKDPNLKNINQKSKALTKIKRANRENIADLLAVTDFLQEDIQVKCGESELVLPTLDSNIKFDLIITDPPWDIGLEDRMTEMRKESEYPEYDKGYDSMKTLEILMLCYDLLKDNCPIYMFYSSIPEKTVEGQKLLLAAGFKVEIIPLKWYKKHVISHNNRETRHDINCETILYGWKGERPFLNQPHRNVFESQVAFKDRIHASEKTEELLTEIVLLHTKEGDRILDPFGGSCKVADACLNTKRKCLVVEKDEGLVKMASLRLRGI